MLSFVKAKGSIQTDENGKEYIDFFCGSGALNYGHNNPYIKEKVVEYLQNDGVMHALDMYTKPKREFIEYFENEVIRPRGFDYKIQFVGPTGTNAVEAALKLARKVKKRNNVFALMGAFHGMTLGSLALTTNADSRKGAGVPLYNVTHIPAPYMFPELDTVAYMERLITDDHSGVEKPAAIILETTQADGGIYVLPDEWLRRVRALCDKYDILMIVDDVQVGASRIRIIPEQANAKALTAERAVLPPANSQCVCADAVAPGARPVEAGRAQRHIPRLSAVFGRSESGSGVHAERACGRRGS